MKPALNARLPPAMAPNVAKRPRSANTSAADRKQVFVNTISEAIERGCLRDSYLTALLREVDRLVRHWPDDVRGLVLTDDISPKVRQMLTAAVERAGLTVIEHQPSSSSSSVHIHAAEMKRPPAEDVEEAVGPEVHVAALAPLTPLAPSRTPRQNIDAIEGVLNRHCSRARTQDGDNAYWKASRTRDAVMKAVMQGTASVEVDLPAVLVTELAQFGVACRPSVPAQAQIGLKELNEPTLEFLQLAVAMYAGDAAEVTAVMRGLKEPARTLLQDSSLMVAMRRGHASTLTAFMDGLKGFGLSQKKMGDIASRFDLMHALSGGQSAAVTAYMDGLKALGLSSHQIEKILCAKRWGMKMLMAAIMHTQPAALTAFMGGLHGAVLSSDQVYRIVELDRVDVVISTAVSEAYRDGLRLLARQQLITAEQLSHLDARMSVWVQWSVSRAGT